MNDAEDVQLIAETLAEAGINLNLAYGSRLDEDVSWSSNVMTKSGLSFEHPISAEDMLSAAEAAVAECRVRGWL